MTLERTAQTYDYPSVQSVGELALQFLAAPETTPPDDSRLTKIMRLGQRILRFATDPTTDDQENFKVNETRINEPGLFEQTVENLYFQELAVIPTGRKRPRSIEQFSFLPLVCKAKDRPSLHTAYKYAPIPEGIKTTYESDVDPGGVPWLDTRFTIGLARNRWLVAVAAAGVEKQNGSLIIKQLQDVSGTSRRRDAKEHFSTGLHDGFLWKDTLVAAWATVAMELGIGRQLTIQSSVNNDWAYERRLPHYDELAQRLHFTRVNSEDNWRKPLPRKPV